MDFIIFISKIIIDAIITNITIILYSLAALIAAIIASYYAYKSYKISKFETSKNSKLEIGFYAKKGTEKFYILLPLKKNIGFIFPLVLSIYNDGDISAKNIEIYYKVSKSLDSADSDKILSSIALAKGSKFASELMENKQMTRSYFKVGEIAPDDSVNVGLELMWGGSESIIKRNVKAKDKDGIDFIAKVEILVSMTVDFKITYENSKPIEKTITLEFRRLDKNEGLTDFIMREEELLKRFNGKQRNISIDPEFYRVITFGGFEEIKKTKEDRKMMPHYKFFRCNESSMRYKDICLLKDKILVAKNYGDLKKKYSN
jgi:hypothetical protein